MRILLRPTLPSSSFVADNYHGLLKSPLKIGFACALFLHLCAYLLVSIPPLPLPSPFLFPQVEVSRISPASVLSPLYKASPIPIFAQPPPPTLDELFPLPAYPPHPQNRALFHFDPREALSFLPPSVQHATALFIVSGELASVPILEKPQIATRSLPSKLPPPRFFSYAIKVDPTTGRPFWFAPVYGESNPWVEEQIQYFRFSPRFLSLFSEGMIEVTVYP